MAPLPTMNVRRRSHSLSLASTFTSYSFLAGKAGDAENRIAHRGNQNLQRAEAHELDGSRAKRHKELPPRPHHPIHQEVPGFKSGAKVEFNEGMEKLIKENPSAFQVYERATVELQKGDTVRFTANQEFGGHKINIGATYKVDGFDKEKIILANGWKGESELLTNGLVDTSFASQGKTVDQVIVVQGDQSLPAANMAQSYVSVSRGREKASVWVDSNHDTLEAIQRDDKRLLASDLVRRPRHKIRSRLKRHVAFLRQLPLMVVDRVRDMVMPTQRENARGY